MLTSISYLLLTISITFGCIVIIGVNLSKNLYLEKSISIKASPKEVFDMIYNMEQWIHWFPHLKDDKSAEIVLYDDTHRPSMCQWSGDQFSGTAKITESQKNKSIKIMFQSTEYGLVNSDFRIIESDEYTTLIWGCRIPIEQDPFQKLISHTMYKNVFMHCMTDGLESLKKHLQQNS